MKKIKEYLKIDKFYIFILVVSVLLMLPLMNNLYFEGHDTGYHIANILAICENLNFHNLFTLKIFPIIANNFGYGAGIFYPQLSHIVAAFFYNIFSISVFTSIKLTNFVVIFLSGIFMYKVMKTITKNNSLSFVASLFYLTAPYKLYDYIVRDALAESFVFVFLPLIFLGVYYLLNKNKKGFYIYFVTGYVGLINSHLVLIIYTTIFLFIILLIHIKKVWNKEIIKHLIFATIIVLCICLPFIIPLVIHKLNGSYVVFSKDAMANAFGVYRGGLSYHFFFGHPKDIGLHFINYVALGLIIYLFIKLWKEKKWKETIKNDFLFTIGLLCTVLGIWMSSLLFPWFILPDFLLMIQFPWRLGTFTAFGVSILSFYALEKCNSKQWLLKNISIVSCILVASFCLFTQNFSYITENNYDIPDIGMGWQKEYLPTNAKENIEYLKGRSDEVLVIDGTASVEEIINDTPYLQFRVTNVSNCTLELPRLYYIGYEIIAKNSEEEKHLTYSENENGFIEIKVEEDSIIEMKYTGTKIQRLGNWISIITIVGCLVIILVEKFLSLFNRKIKKC